MLNHQRLRRTINTKQAGTWVELTKPKTVIYASVLILYPAELLSFNMVTTEKANGGLNKVPIKTLSKTKQKKRSKKINTAAIYCMYHHLVLVSWSMMHWVLLLCEFFMLLRLGAYTHHLCYYTLIYTHISLLHEVCLRYMRQN